MSMTDPISDMLTRIRNACGSKHRRVDIPASKVKVEIARILLENNYIRDVKTVETAEGWKVLRLYLRYAGEQPVIREIRRVSTPGLRKYVGVSEIPPEFDKNGKGVCGVIVVWTRDPRKGAF